MNWTEIVTDPLGLPSELPWTVRRTTACRPLGDIRNTRQLDVVWIAGQPLEVVR